MNILLLDTNFSSAPIYDYLIESGNEVYVIGNNPNDFLAKSVKNYIQSDYTKILQTQELIKSYKIDFIVPGCNDRSYQVYTELNSNNQFSLSDSSEINEIINNKEKFRSFATASNLSVPKVVKYEEIGEFWPLIVKPVDSYSGMGITIIKEQELIMLPSALKFAKENSRTKTCIIEEFVEGQLFSHSAFISNKSILIDFIVEEHGTANSFAVDTSRVIYDFSKEILNNIREEIQQMADELNLVDGLIHTQFIKSGNTFWIIEVTRRCPGDLYSYLIESSTGFDYAKAYTEPFLKQKICLSNNALHKNNILRHTISNPKEGYFSSLQFNRSVHIDKMVQISSSGDFIKSSPSGRIGLMFIRAESKRELNSIYETTLERELYSIK
jgi:carbamoylphosphate synthase large subunit